MNNYIPLINMDVLNSDAGGLLMPNLVKSQNREIGCYNDTITLKLDRLLGSIVAEVPVKFQSDWKSLNPNFGASRLHEILQ